MKTRKKVDRKDECNYFSALCNCLQIEYPCLMPLRQNIMPQMWRYAYYLPFLEHLTKLCVYIEFFLIMLSLTFTRMIAFIS